MTEKNGNGDAPTQPTDMHRREWGAVLKRTVKEFKRDELTDKAAALTYYSVLALFPALIALVSIVGLLGKSTVASLKSNIAAIPAAGQAKQIVLNTITSLSAHPHAAGIAFIVGLALALWSASGYIGAFIRASNNIYEVGEGRPFYKLRPMQLAITFVMLMLLVIGGLAVVISGPVLDSLASLVGLGGTFKTVFSIVKWPVLALVVTLIFSVLYYAAPNVKQPGFKWITPGGVLAVIIWVIASVAFALYTKHFPNNK